MKILIIEDDKAIVELVSLSFQVGWPEVELISSHLGKEGIELVESESPDIVILDLGLPDISGFEVLRGLRRFTTVPIVILTVRSEEADVVKALEWGADEYIIKPFRQLELLARIKSLMRRQYLVDKDMPTVCGPFRFDRSMRRVFYGSREIFLTTTESLILYQLAKNAGQVVSYSNLINAVWGDFYPDAVDALRVYIRHLREKIEKDPGQPQIITTKTGIGYLMPKQEWSLPKQIFSPTS
jgi:two-component system KDP operon response regulator KdpE